MFTTHTHIYIICLYLLILFKALASWLSWDGVAPDQPSHPDLRLPEICAGRDQCRWASDAWWVFGDSHGFKGVLKWHHLLYSTHFSWVDGNCVVVCLVCLVKAFWYHDHLEKSPQGSRIVSWRGLADGPIADCEILWRLLCNTWLTNGWHINTYWHKRPFYRACPQMRVALTIFKTPSYLAAAAYHGQSHQGSRRPFESWRSSSSPGGDAGAAGRGQKANHNI